MNILLYQILGFTLLGKVKSSYKNNEFKIPGPTLNEEYESTDGSYSISDIIILNIY